MEDVVAEWVADFHALNVWRKLGDVSHTLAIFVLLISLWATKNAAGISLKAVELFLISFVSRYLDLLTISFGIYNTAMKILFIVSTACIVATVRCTSAKQTYDRSRDSFRLVKFALVPCLAIAFLTAIIRDNILLWNDEPLWFQADHALRVLYNLSVCLEAMAVVPQLVMLRSSNAGERKSWNQAGVLCVLWMAAYRGFYILNWIHRRRHEWRFRDDYVQYTFGAVQTAMSLYGVAIWLSLLLSGEPHSFCRVPGFLCFLLCDRRASTRSAWALRPQPSGNGGDSIEVELPDDATSQRPVPSHAAEEGMVVLNGSVDLRTPLLQADAA